MIKRKKIHKGLFVLFIIGIFFIAGCEKAMTFGKKPTQEQPKEIIKPSIEQTPTVNIQQPITNSQPQTPKAQLPEDESISNDLDEAISELEQLEVRNL